MKTNRGDARPSACPVVSPLDVSVLPVCVPALILALVFAAGCAAPSEPVTRHPPIANPITDLSAHQLGSRVFLTFSLPAKTTDRKGITVTPSLEVHWAFLSAGTLATTAAAIEKQSASVVRVPSAMVDQYKIEGHVRLPVELKADDVEHHFGAMAAFAVRTKISEKGISDSSNVSITRVYPAAAPISDLAAKVTEKAVELSWTAATLPALPSNAGSASPIVTYRVYRDEKHETQASPATAPPQTPSELLAESPSPGYRDTTFEFGHAYIYSVRSLIQYGSTPADSVESGDSNLIVLTPKDIFPPAAPAGLVAIEVPATPDVPAHIELSWAISPETDLSGYN
ncbi:MAG TPA: hypothetical protein VEJ39_01585, partial [Candidatus Acidoferrales bacterium]|nr:hypothetical protein [Candidatus Acidoferrales bacterium]